MSAALVITERELQLKTLIGRGGIRSASWAQCSAPSGSQYLHSRDVTHGAQHMEGDKPEDHKEP